MQYCTQVIEMLRKLESNRAADVVTALLRDLVPDFKLAQSVVNGSPYPRKGR